MKLTHGLLTAWLAAVTVQCHSAARADAPPRTAHTGAASSPSQKPMLTDTSVLARVDDRAITVLDFRDRFFTSDAVTRPVADSAGRAEFLQSMIDKEVLESAALARGEPLTLEHRLELREFTQDLLAKMYVHRRTVEPVIVTDKDVRDIYPQYGYELHLRYILFDDERLARRVRADLLAGRISWSDAERRHSMARDSLHGDLGWVRRGGFTRVRPHIVFALKPSSISEVLTSLDGYSIWQCVDRRNVSMPTYSAVRREILSELQAARSAPLMAQLFSEARLRAKAVYDTANILWLAEHFREANVKAGETQEGTFDLRSRVPDITPADTGRVLARASYGVFSVGWLLAEYRRVPAMFRGKIVSFTNLANVLDAMVLRNAIADMAREHGQEKDPETQAHIERRRAAYLVHQLYEDSVMSRVRVTAEARRRYYEEHRHEFMSKLRVHYAMFPRPSERAADSLIAALRAGASAESIRAVDERGGVEGSTVDVLVEDQLHRYRSLLLEELRPGQSSKLGPYRNGSMLVVHVISHDAPRPMALGEVQQIVDESIENLEAEKILAAMLTRLRARHRIESRPQDVMRFVLTDPVGDWNLPPGN